ncbi:MAG: carboxypeptidase-like regulatory domain-containing protein [Prevotella sp.]|nr:carboxypeptidase-like regulatory domain-containing protein [Prevotella sp.]
MKRAFVLSLTILLVCLNAWSQQPVTVSGTVVSHANGRPLSGVSISGGGQTVVTNDDGFFQLKADSLLKAVNVSHVGYYSQHLALSDANTQHQLSIRLRPTSIQLKEVLVVAYADPRELIAAAISKIPQNYSRQPELHHCFYRETAMKRQHHIMVAEGVVDMYKSGYSHGTGRDRVAIRKGRRLLSPRKGDTLSVKVTGGPVTPVQLDLVKNLDLLLNKDDLDCYELKMEAPTATDDRPQYVVSLTPARVMPWPLYYGRLYIDQQTLAITRAELSLDMRDRDKATRQMLVRKPAGVRFRPRELSFVIDYRQDDDGLTRISYVRTTFRFNCDWRRRLFATSFTAVCELAVTSTTSLDVQPLRGRESFDQRDAFYDKVDFFRDPVFWQDYNIIEPTESLDRAVERLLKKY